MQKTSQRKGRTTGRSGLSTPLLIGIVVALAVLAGASYVVAIAVDLAPGGLGAAAIAGLVAMIFDIFCPRPEDRRGSVYRWAEW